MIGAGFLEPVRIKTSPFFIDYGAACQEMATCVQAIKADQSPEILWFLQHAPLYTFGARTDPAHIQAAHKTGLPVQPSLRGGLMTFHGPEQRIVYGMLHLRRRQIGIHTYVNILQDWIIAALAEWGIVSWKDPEHVGVWTSGGKIASIGVRVSGGVSSHGFAVNVFKSAGEFQDIVPCGLVGVPMISIQDMYPDIGMPDWDQSMIRNHPFVV